MHWAAVSAARGASRAPKSAAKVTSAKKALPTSCLSVKAIGKFRPSIVIPVKKWLKMLTSRQRPTIRIPDQSHVSKHEVKLITNLLLIVVMTLWVTSSSYDMSL